MSAAVVKVTQGVRAPARPSVRPQARLPALMKQTEFFMRCPRHRRDGRRREIKQKQKENHRANEVTCGGGRRRRGRGEGESRRALPPNPQTRPQSSTTPPHPVLLCLNMHFILTFAHDPSAGRSLISQSLSSDVQPLSLFSPPPFFLPCRSPLILIDYA